MQVMKVGAALVVVFSLFNLFNAISREEPRVREIEPYVSWSGARSAIGERCALLAGSEKEWIDVWLRHQGVAGKWKGTYSTFYNPAGVPHVNFTECMVIAIFQGECTNSAGLALCAIEESGDGLRVRYENKSYQTLGPDGGGEKATPFVILVLPPSPGTVIVEEKVLHLKNSLPTWKEHARIERP